MRITGGRRVAAAAVVAAAAANKILFVAVSASSGIPPDQQRLISPALGCSLLVAGCSAALALAFAAALALALALPLVFKQLSRMSRLGASLRRRARARAKAEAWAHAEARATAPVELMLRDLAAAEVKLTLPQDYPVAALRSEAARHWEHPAARVRLVFDTTLLHDAVLERPASSRGTMRLPDYNIGHGDVVTCVLLPPLIKLYLVELDDYFGHRLIPHDFVGSDTIDEVKAKIQDETGIHAATMSLCCQGQLLKNGQTLSDYDIKDGSDIWMRSRGANLGHIMAALPQ